MSFTQNTYQRLYGTSPGPSYLNITGCRLPTYLQVLLCYESNRKKLIAEKKGTKYNWSWKFEAIKIVYKEVTVHYKKSSIDLKNIHGFQYEFEKVLEHHKSLVKGNKGKGIDLKKNHALMAQKY